MAGVRWRRIGIVAVVLGGLGLCLTATILRWPVWLLPTGIGVGLLLIAALSLPTRRRKGAPELYASDEYSDAQLGRSRPTHPYQDPEAASQIGAALPVDPLRLPDTPFRQS